MNCPKVDEVVNELYSLRVLPIHPTAVGFRPIFVLTRGTLRSDSGETTSPSFSSSFCVRIFLMVASKASALPRGRFWTMYPLCFGGIAINAADGVMTSPMSECETIGLFIDGICSSS